MNVAVTDRYTKFGSLSVLKLSPDSNLQAGNRILLSLNVFPSLPFKIRNVIRADECVLFQLALIGSAAVQKTASPPDY